MRPTADVTLVRPPRMTDLNPGASAVRATAATGSPTRGGETPGSRHNRRVTPRPRRTGLVGRAAEWRALDRELGRCTAGAFGCLVLVGDAGVGKSRLAAEFVADRGRDLTVLTARAYHLGATDAFGVWAEAVDGALRTRTRDEVRRVCAGAEYALAGLLRSVAAARGGAPAVDPPRTHVLDALASLLRALTAERPVVVVIDDLPLADASSVEALHYLAHHCADRPVLVVGTARAETLAARPATVEALVRLEQDGFARRLAVGPLDGPALRELAAAVLGSAPPDALVAWLAERTHGNPLDAVDLLGALVEQGADLHRPALERLPEALSDRVALRLHGVDPVAGTVVELLAVIGRRAELRSLVALSGRTPGELVEALERLVRARLVTEDDRGPDVTVEVAHPLVADAVYERMGAARRRLLHREVARVLTSMGRPAEAAAHFARSAGPGDDEAVVALRTAVQVAERAGAFEESLTLLDALVGLLPAGDPRWLDVVDALSWDALWVIDHRADSHAALGVPALRAMDAALAGIADPARRAPVTLRLANFLGWGDGTLAEAAAVCRAAVALYAQAGDRRGELLATHELAWLEGLAGDLAVLEDGARAVADEARRSGDAVVLSRAVRTIGLMAIWRGRPADAADAFEEAAAHAAGDPYRLFLSAAADAAVAILSGRATDGLAVLDAIHARTPGALVDYDSMFSWLTGRISRARAITRDVTGIGPTPACRRVGLGLIGAAFAAVEVGRFDEAHRWSARLRDLYDGSGWALHAAYADHVDALLRWRDGDTDGALALLRRAARVLLAGDMLMQVGPLLCDLAEIAGRAGRPEPDVVATLAGIADRTGLGMYRGFALLATAWSAHGAGDRRASAEEAAAALVDWPLHRGRALYLSSLTADRDRAVADLTEAADLFDTCGATLRRTEALDTLAALGTRGMRAAAAALGPSSLTAREREVAQLAADGLSAREIAATLFIGERTVEGHLARAYARLGVRSKVELARRAAEFGLRSGTLRTGTRTGTPDPSIRRS